MNKPNSQNQAERKGKLVLIVGLPMLLFGLGALIFRAIPSYEKAIHLRRAPAIASAQIIGIYAQSQGPPQAEYRFSFAGQTYVGRDAYRLQFGSHGPAEVFYLPSDPTYSALDPDAKVQHEKFGLIVFTIWNILVVVFMFAIRRMIQMEQKAR